MSADVLARFDMAELIESLSQHGPARTRAHQTKHRFRSGTLTVLSNASKGEVFIVSPTELRLLMPPKRPR